jgi:ferredoxin-thioredoxin reductase catalytic subunit
MTKPSSLASARTSLKRFWAFDRNHRICPQTSGGRRQNIWVLPNSAADLLQMFLEGLKINEERYGYPVCPCRLGTGKLDLDRDIICPCDYRDPDVAQYGACYCRSTSTKPSTKARTYPKSQNAGQLRK